MLTGPLFLSASVVGYKREETVCRGSLACPPTDIPGLKLPQRDLQICSPATRPGWLGQNNEAMASGLGVLKNDL